MKTGTVTHTPNSNVAKMMYIFLVITDSPLLVFLAIDLYKQTQVYSVLILAHRSSVAEKEIEFLICE
ncbi:hypothetical protein F4826_004705 [Rahnella inusitata]|nr:hypothetical protein [Rahnella inusitata]